MILVTDYQVLIEHAVRLNSNSVGLVIFAKIEFQDRKKLFEAFCRKMIG